MNNSFENMRKTYGIKRQKSLGDLGDEEGSPQDFIISLLKDKSLGIEQPLRERKTFKNLSREIGDEEIVKSKHHNHHRNTL